jgi:hypothetical protein
VKDDIWMEYNPELLKSSKTKKYLSNLLLDKDNKERIRLFEIKGKPDENDKILKQELDNINKKIKPSIHKGYERIATIMDYTTHSETINPNGKHESKLNKSIFNLPFGLNEDRNAPKKKYIPPYLRNKGSAEDSSKQSGTTPSGIRKYDINKNSQGVRLSNIPNDITENELKDWLSSFNLPSGYRINMIKDRNTGAYKPFAFIIFRSVKYATDAIDILNGAKFEYNIISSELAKF